MSPRTAAWEGNLSVTAPHHQVAEEITRVQGAFVSRTLTRWVDAVVGVRQRLVLGSVMDSGTGHVTNQVTNADEHAHK